MFSKFLSLFILVGLIATTDLSIFAQSQFLESKNSRQPQTLTQNQFVNSAERTKQLLDKDAFYRISENSLSVKAMQDADKLPQKKKFAGIGTTTAIIIGGVIAAAIVVVLATKGNNEQRTGQIYCGGIQAPCP